MNFNDGIKWSPQNYLTSACVAKEAELELLSRAEWMTIDPKIVIDLGCGLGNASQQLMLKYPRAKIISIDANPAMLAYTQTHVNPEDCFCADATHLPLQDASVDLIFANFLLPWQANFNLCFTEWRRVLRPQGLLMFSALGPNTLQELQTFAASISLPQFHDVHNIGDGLLFAKFADPVLDVTHLTTHYQNYSQLIAELCDSGFLHASNAQDLKEMSPAKETFSLSYEIIFAHAFVPDVSSTIAASKDNDDVRISLAQFKKMVNSQT